MGLAPKYNEGQTLYLKKMGLPVVVIMLHRGAPNRYTVTLSGTRITVTEKQLTTISSQLKLGRRRRFAKFTPGSLVRLTDSTLAVVLSSHKYRKGFRYKIATPSKILILDEVHIKGKIRWQGKEIAPTPANINPI